MTNFEEHYKWTITCGNINLSDENLGIKTNNEMSATQKPRVEKERNNKQYSG